MLPGEHTVRELALWPHPVMTNVYDSMNPVYAAHIPDATTFHHKL